MTNEEIQALQALADKATKGPWTYLVINGLDTVVDAKMQMIIGDGDPSEPDRAVDYVNLDRDEYRFIAAAREAVPALCADLLAARAEVARLREALESIRQYGSDTLSGRADGPDDRNWQRDGVREMTRRARTALEGGK